MAEGVGFEPTEVAHLTRFPSVPIRPLWQPSLTVPLRDHHGMTQLILPPA